MLRVKAARLTRLCLNQCANTVPEFAACEIVPLRRTLSTCLIRHSSDRERESGDRCGGNSSNQPSLGFAIRGFSGDGTVPEDDSATVKTLETESGFPDETTTSIAESGAGFFGADAITAAAETAALSEAWDEAWIINRTFQYLIQWAHEATGTPWWQSIGIATLVCRLAVLPLVVKQMNNMERLKKSKPETEALSEWYNQKKELGLGKEYQLEYTTRLSELWAKYDCQPIKSMLPLFAQAPIFLGFFGALRTMASAQVPSFTSGGVTPPQVLVDLLGPENSGWLSDLTIADPCYTLPVLSAAIFLISVRLNAADGMQGHDDKTLSRMKNFMYGLGAVMIPFTAGMPQSVFCYWITSNLYSLVQGTVFKIKGVRRAIGLPPLSVAKQTKAANVKAVVEAAAATGKPVITYSAPPNRHTPAAARQTSALPQPGLSGKPVVLSEPPRRPKAAEGKTAEVAPRSSGGKRSGGQRKPSGGKIRPWSS